MMETKGKEYLSMLDKPLNDIDVTREQIKLVLDVLEKADIEPAKGMYADAIIKQLAKKYYPYCKKSLSLPVFLNALYAILTGENCTVSYLVAACVRQAEVKQEEDGLRLPIEFYLSETLEAVETAPNTFKVFAGEDEESNYTLRQAIESILGKELILPDDVNRVVPYPGTPNYLAFVENKTRWLAVLASDVAARVTMYSNPIVSTPKGLMQGDTYLRCIGERRGIVLDDFVVL